MRLARRTGGRADVARRSRPRSETSTSMTSSAVPASTYRPASVALCGRAVSTRRTKRGSTPRMRGSICAGSIRLSPRARHRRRSRSRERNRQLHGSRLAVNGGASRQGWTPGGGGSVHDKPGAEGGCSPSSFSCFFCDLTYVMMAICFSVSTPPNERTKARAPPSSMIAPEMRSRSILNRRVVLSFVASAVFAPVRG
jgi:hypothetical protein